MKEITNLCLEIHQNFMRHLQSEHNAVYQRKGFYMKTNSFKTNAD